MKLGEWTVVILTMILFLELFGITTGLGVILSQFGIATENGVVTDADLEGSSIWTEILAALAVVAVGGAVIIGLFAKSYDTSLVIAPLILFVVGIFGSTFFSIISIPEISDVVWIKNIISILFIGMGGAFVWSAVDYFAGR